MRRRHAVPKEVIHLACNSAAGHPLTARAIAKMCAAPECSRCHPAGEPADRGGQHPDGILHRRGPPLPHRPLPPPRRCRRLRTSSPSGSGAPRDDHRPVRPEWVLKWVLTPASASSSQVSRMGRRCLRALPRDRRGRRREYRTCHRSGGQREEECRALARDAAALEPDAPAHRLDIRPADR
jgi:hypothetical protein